ncbi:IS4 family transposase [Streptomyces sp. SLBN-118]|uniref:ISAs1 family transposase n=1 Tax=Streptomyces sp. SLBN-118 TaxID=2768454 RepID=UPI00116A16BC|nr:ISAs1 family transposase [Streptomyces sp. SLBN-118]TQK52408.1 IS4 family transposase [Streptomyces sp. SLBN-118]
MCRQSAAVCLVKSPTRQQRCTADLAVRLRTLSDPRHRRGVRHPFVSVLLVACSAVISGARSFAAIGQWAKNAPQETLARLGARTTSVFGVRLAPSGATIRRLVNRTCPGGLADLLGCDPADADSLAVDGKSARGSRTDDSPAAHLLAAITDTGQAVTQLRVPDKTNEITCFAALLEPYDLAGVVVTADALHTQRDHARYLGEKSAHYAFTVKRNQPNLYAQLKALPWKEARARFYDRSTGHGRLETRVVQVLTVTDLGVDFPHAAQVARIVRHRTDRKTGRRSRETVCVLTDLTSRQASPQRIAQLIRAQWVIENRLHFVRDVTFAEDASKIRTGHGPDNMAALRSFAINPLRAAGHTNIAAALRDMSYEPFTRPLDLLKIS